MKKKFRLWVWYDIKEDQIFFVAEILNSACEQNKNFIKLGLL